MSSPSKVKVLVTGARGFIGKNLVVLAGERPDIDLVTFDRGDGIDRLLAAVAEVEAVVHLAGENRPRDESGFEVGNVELTETLCAAVRKSGRKTPIVYASSIQAAADNGYGRSKRSAELAIERLCGETGNPATIYRLSNVFGKWCRPNYNSVVATFCHNIARDLPVHLHDPSAPLRLVYIDDVMAEILSVIAAGAEGLNWREVQPDYQTTVGELAAQIEAFRNCRTGLVSERVGTGLARALYATYVSFLPTDKFAYAVPQYADARGTFVEMLKTPDCGQFSFFTARPGVTRGGHYHHTKTEKFLVVCGSARFAFRHILTGETYELRTASEVPQIVESVPGWAHDITNVGSDDMVVMLWANEIFDRDRPDTVVSKV